MVHVLTPRPNLGAVLGQALGSSVGAYLQNQQQQQQEQQKESKLQEALSQVEGIYNDPNLSPQQKEVSIYRALSSRPDIAQALSQQNLKREQFTQKSQDQKQAQEQKSQDQKQAQEQKIQETRNLLRAIEKDRGLEEGALEGYLSNPSLAASMNKPEKPPAPTPFEKQKQIDFAKQYKEDKIQILKARDALKNITRMEELSKSLSGVFGYGKALLNTGDAAEFDALGLAAIEPILKIFNPVGAIPTQKINIIRDRFAPKATDRQTTIDGKLRALKAFNQQAMARAEARVALIDQYQGNPPAEVLNKFDDETETLADAMLDYPISSPSQASPSQAGANKQAFEDLPNPSEHPNKVIVNQKTGQKLKSDGKKWNPIQ